MTRKQYLAEFQEHYQLVTIPRDKPDYTIYRFRHRKLERDIILRSYAQPIPAYEKLVSLLSENLPEVYDVITLEDGMIVLEEYIDSSTVAEIAETGRYTKSAVRKVVKSVCNALSILHQCDIVHRDVKPENIMVTAAGRVVLIDFNTARQLSGGSKDTAVMGTVGYVSPEQLGLTKSDARTDIYAVGVLLNVLLTGKHPSEQLAKGYIGNIVRKCTDINPGNRYQTAKRLADAL